MKIAAIGNSRVLLGLGLAGIESIYETTLPEKALSFIDKLIASGEYGLIIITSDLYHLLVSDLAKHSEKQRLPLFVEFKPPGRHLKSDI